MNVLQLIYPLALVDVWVVSKVPFYNWCYSGYFCMGLPVRWRVSGTYAHKDCSWSENFHLKFIQPNIVPIWTRASVYKNSWLLLISVSILPSLLPWCGKWCDFTVQIWTLHGGSFWDNKYVLNLVLQWVPSSVSLLKNYRTAHLKHVHFIA